MVAFEHHDQPCLSHGIFKGHGLASMASICILQVKVGASVSDCEGHGRTKAGRLKMACLSSEEKEGGCSSAQRHDGGGDQQQFHAPTSVVFGGG